MSDRTFVGVNPWLPWPLSGWRWWTAPIRAERLAVLRIGLAAVLLGDILLTYRPHAHDFYGQGSLGSPEIFDYLAQAPRWNWSLLRGLQDPLLLSLAQLVWLVTTAVVLLGLWGRLTATPQGNRHPVLRNCLIAWTASSVVALFGLWVRLSPAPDAPGSSLVWRIPMVVFGVGTVFWCLALWKRLLTPADQDDRWVWRWVLVAWVVSGVLAGLGMWRALDGAASPQPPFWLGWASQRWHAEPTVIAVAMLAWAGSALLLMIGWQTRLAAVLAWALSVSVDNLNWYVNNAGDQVRNIVLFYLMLCPCAAAWSVDSWRARRRGRLTGAAYVSPWPLRLLFVQMVFMYFCNGMYKVFGTDWGEGASLYHVWCDVTLSRYSYAQLPIPFWITQVMSLTVLLWELSFPLLVLTRWTRPVALLFGVAFHLGIFVTMELGPFGLYLLTLYVPLLPWERWLEGPDARAQGEEVRGQGPQREEGVRTAIRS